jgi:hypothetical protein
VVVVERLPIGGDDLLAPVLVLLLCHDAPL